MELSVLDRLLLLSVLPKEGDVTTLRIVRKLREDLSFTEDEHKALNFKQTETGLQWSTEGNVPKDITIGPKAQVLIAEALEALNKEKKLTAEFLSLYDTFVEPDKDI